MSIMAEQKGTNKSPSDKDGNFRGSDGGNKKFSHDPIGQLARRIRRRKAKQTGEENTENKDVPEGEEEEVPKVSDIVSTIDLHGVNDLYTSESIASKIAWGIVLVIAIFMLVVELYEVFVEYRDNPISTSYSIMAESDGLGLPTIYLCPMTPIHEGQRKKVNVPSWWEAERNVSALFQASGLSEGDGEASILGQKKKIWDEIEVAANEADNRDEGDCDMLLDGITTTPRPEYIPKDVEDYFMKVGYPVDTLFRECSFATDSFNCNEVVEEVFDRDYGKCFLLNSEKFVQRLPGIGLSLALNLDTRKAYTKNPPLFDGLVMKIEYHFDMAGYRKLLLHPSQYTIVGLNAVKYNLIEQSRPTGGTQQCRDADVGQAELKILESNYTLGVCRMDCMQAAILESCHCVLAMSRKYIKKHLFAKNPGFEKDPYCSYGVMQECAFPLIRTAKDNPAFRDCYQKCEVPCEFWEFNAEMSSVKFPSDMFLNPTATGEKKKRKKREADVQKGREHADKFQRLKRKAETTVSTEAKTVVTAEPSTESSATNVDSSTTAPKMASSSTESSASDSPSSSSTESSAIQSTGSTTEGSSDYYEGYEDYEDDDEDSGDTAEILAAQRRALEESCKEDSFQTQDWLDYIIVDIAYSNLQYTEITQENAISFTAAVSDVGGQFGLWLGASIISMIKIFLITGPMSCFTACIGMRRRRIERKTHRKMINHTRKKSQIHAMSLAVEDKDHQEKGKNSEARFDGTGGTILVLYDD